MSQVNQGLIIKRDLWQCRDCLYSCKKAEVGWKLQYLYTKEVKIMCCPKCNSTHIYQLNQPAILSKFWKAN